MKIAERNVILKTCISIVFFIVFQIIKISFPYQEQLTAITILIIAAIIVAILVMIKDEREARAELDRKE